MTWKQCLLAQITEIIKHRDGELNFVVRPYRENEVKIIIKAGKSWNFIINPFDEED